MIRHEINGLAPWPGDEAAFVAAAVAMARDSAMRRQLGQQATLDMSRNAWERITRRLEEVLGEVIVQTA